MKPIDLLALKEAHDNLKAKFEIIETDSPVLAESQRDAATDIIIESIVPFVENQLLIEMSEDVDGDLVNEDITGNMSRVAGPGTEGQPAEPPKADDSEINVTDKQLIGTEEEQEAALDKKAETTPADQLKETIALSVWFQSLFNLTFGISSVAKFKTKLAAWAAEKDSTLTKILNNEGGCLFNESIKKSHPMSLLGLMFYTPNSWANGSQELTGLLTPLAPTQKAIRDVLDNAEIALTEVPAEEESDGTTSTENTVDGLIPLIDKAFFSEDELKTLKTNLTNSTDVPTFQKFKTALATAIVKLPAKEILAKFGPFVKSQKVLAALKDMEKVSAQSFYLSLLMSKEPDSNIITDILKNVNLESNFVKAKVPTNVVQNTKASEWFVKLMKKEDMKDVLLESSNRFESMLKKYLVVEGEIAVDFGKPVDPEASTAKADQEVQYNEKAESVGKLLANSEVIEFQKSGTEISDKVIDGISVKLIPLEKLDLSTIDWDKNECVVVSPQLATVAEAQEEQPRPLIMVIAK